MTLALVSACATLRPVQLSPGSPLGDVVMRWIGDAMKPVYYLCLGAAAFRVQENRWPSSLDELRPIGGGDKEWAAALAEFTDVAILPRPDGSVAITAKTRARSLGQGATLKPMTITADVRIRSAPGTKLGWEPQIVVGSGSTGAPASPAQTKPSGPSP